MSDAALLFGAPQDEIKKPRRGIWRLFGQENPGGPAKSFLSRRYWQVYLPLPSSPCQLDHLHHRSNGLIQDSEGLVYILFGGDQGGRETEGVAQATRPDQ